MSVELYRETLATPIGKLILLTDAQGHARAGLVGLRDTHGNLLTASTARRDISATRAETQACAKCVPISWVIWARWTGAGRHGRHSTQQTVAQCYARFRSGRRTARLAEHLGFAGSARAVGLGQLAPIRSVRSCPVTA
ncbi:MAG: hypothetical protein R3F04_06125 [Lysobacteraceae bacterium]